VFKEVLHPQNFRRGKVNFSFRKDCNHAMPCIEFKEVLHQQNFRRGKVNLHYDEDYDHASYA